jgi:hypothetical protein
MATLEELQDRLRANRERHAGLSVLNWSDRARINRELGQISQEIRQQGGDPEAMVQAFQRERQEQAAREQTARMESERQRMLAQGRGLTAEGRSSVAADSETPEQREAARLGREAQTILSQGSALEQRRAALDSMRLTPEEQTSLRAGIALERQRSSDANLGAVGRRTATARAAQMETALNAFSEEERSIAQAQADLTRRQENFLTSNGEPGRDALAQAAERQRTRESGDTQQAGFLGRVMAAFTVSAAQATVVSPPANEGTGIADPSTPPTVALASGPTPPVPAPTPAGSPPTLVAAANIPTPAAPPVAPIAEPVSIPPVPPAPPTVAPLPAPEAAASAPAPVQPVQGPPAPAPAREPVNLDAATHVVRLGGVHMRGHHGDGIRQVQEALQRALPENWRDSRGRPLSLDGRFGPQTEEAVRVYQQQAGVTVDGRIGPQTLTRLGMDSGHPNMAERLQPPRVGARSAEVTGGQAVSEIAMPATPVASAAQLERASTGLG